MSIPIGKIAVGTLTVGALVAVRLQKFFYYRKRELEAQKVMSEFDQAYMDLDEISLRDLTADIDLEYGQSTDDDSEINQEDDVVVPEPHQPPPIEDMDLPPPYFDPPGAGPLVPYLPPNPPPAAPVVVRRYDVRSRRPRNIIAFALAQEAYYKFGARPRSEANNLITRKWMVDRLSTMADVRYIDRSNIVDKALVLSFVPTLDSREMEDLANAYSFTDRSASTPFYRLFS